MRDTLRAALRARLRTGLRRRRTAAVVAVAAAAATLIAACTGPTGPGDAGKPAGSAKPARVAHAATGKQSARVTMLCRKDLHMVTVTGVDIRNNNFDGEPECLENRSGDPGFVVTLSGAHKPYSAFPNIFAGCEISACSPDSGMPVKVQDIESLTSTWHFTPAKNWKGDAAYDIWFDPRPRTSGEDTGAEIMLWLDTSQYPKPLAKRVRIDGAWYAFYEHKSHGLHGRTWNYLRFWAISPTTHVDDLDLMPFVTFAEHYKQSLRPAWWLTGVEAGFELWNGGVGAATTAFAVSLKPKP